MSTDPSPPGDKAEVMVQVAVDPAVAWEVFTGEIDLWWRHGPRFRMAGRDVGRITMEAGLGGRLLEIAEGRSGPRVREMGRVTVWEPPSRLVLDFRLANFAPDEKTEVEVRFESSSLGTRVTLQHRGWSRIRADHPARHGEETTTFLRRLGLWWGDLATSLRERADERRGDV